MILFMEDWTSADGRPNAVVHRETSNKSFLRLAAIYKKIGVENNLFHLAITQPDLIKYDPHNLTDSSTELKLRIAHECDVNPWYFLREVLKVPVPGGNGTAFEAHRGNISMAWCFYVGIDYISIQPRQTGKTMCGIALATQVIYFHGRKLTISMLTKDTNLRQENVSRLKAMRDGLPSWLVHTQTADVDNKEGLEYAALQNRYLTFVAQSDKQAASNVGRGMSLPVLHLDEPGYTNNIDIIHPVIMSAHREASARAAQLGMPHSNLYTTTAARTDTTPGAFMFSFVNGAMPFTEKLFDTKDVATAIQMVRNNSVNGKINGTWSYLQLGRTHEWFAQSVAELGATSEEIDRDYLNMWKAGTDKSILNDALVKRINASQMEPIYLQVVDDNYVINWYLPEHIVKSETFQKKQLVLGMDSSENIGRDFTGLVLIDPVNMGVVATFRCNESNIIKIGIFIGNFLVTYSKTVFIPERKSTGGAITDQVILILQKYGFNPFFRIFNRIIQERDKEPYSRISLDQQGLSDSTHRKYLGFQTTGQTRPFLYKNVLNKAAMYNADRIFDRTIISELGALSVVNGRVDHKDGNHDDMAIAYLLACWLIYEGQNLRMYGLDVSQFLQDTPESGDSAAVEYRRQQLDLRRRILHMESVMKAAGSEMLKAHFGQKIHAMKSQLDDSITADPMVHDQVRETLRSQGDVYSKADNRPSMPVPELSRESFSQALNSIM